MSALTRKFSSIRAALSSIAGRASRLDASRVLPPALLILALATLFAFGGDRSYFNRATAHKWTSAKNLALAENLSARDNFRLFTGKWFHTQDSSTRYKLYGRFPIGGTALIKLAIAPFDSLSAKLTAARALALLMFCGAAVFAYLAVARLASSRWIGLAAALIAFSSYYALYFSDEVSNETAMDIFGVALVFHGMAIFVQEGRFRQLLIKACAALLVGWHVYALLLVFIVFGLAGEIVARLRRNGSAGVPPARGRKFSLSILAALIRSRYTALGAAAALFGIVVFGANLANEYYTYEGGAPLTTLSSANAALRKLSLAESAWQESLDWRLFAGQQLYRAGGAALPYALPWKYGFPEPESPPLAGVAVGILAAVGALAAAALARRHKALWAAVALFGFIWALFLRDNVAARGHDYEALFYLGVPLALFGLALMGARGLWGERAVAAAAVAAVAVFAVSAFQIQTGELPGDDPNAETRKAEMADFDAIREKTRGKVVAVFPEVSEYGDNSADYYLAGSVFIRNELKFWKISRADFVVSRSREHGGFDVLTPENREIFLHAPRDMQEFYRWERRRIESAEPAARSDFDLYADGGSLYYVKDPCAESDTRGRFFLHVYPVHIEDLHEERRETGYDRSVFSFASRGAPIFDGACMVKVELPHYPIKGVEAGQEIPGVRRIWSAVASLPLSAETAAHYEAVYEEVGASGEPLIRADFDVYMEGGALTYLKEPCAESDTRGRFFLSVHPASIEDLPESGLDRGHDALNFDFAPHGVMFGGKCMIRRELPSYEIAEISTGQDVPGEGRAWSAERLPISAAAIARHARAYDAAKASGEPIIRSGFDVYLEGDALTYLKDPCGADDARGRFFLSVYPVNLEDLPEDRRELGHDSLNFDFLRHGTLFGGKCIIRRELPGYETAKIATGQDVPGAGRLWSAEAAVGN